MRKKTLAAFAAVYAVICLSYGAVNGIDFPVSTEAAEELSADESVISETQVTTTIPEITTRPTEEATSSKRRNKHGKRYSFTEPAIEEKPQTQTEAPEETPQEIVTEQPETKETDQQIEESIEAPTVPTLEEYLGKLRCGGCGHGCTLLNPRCMRGARKQSSAQSEYQELYG